ncbi:MAG: MFS transporter [Christensenellaceae bacterium]|jgi:GPH family glycoside/pentoside/hexuronide:cation symporter|nr:MFS transporter [Christensenellaceae bacterium]
MLNKLVIKIFGKDSDHEIPNKELLRYCSGIVGQNAMYGLMANWFLLYCYAVLGFDEIIFGTIFAITRIWDAINDPLFGAVIDKHRFKNGEKLRPWIKITCIPLAILIFLLFFNFGLPKGPAMAVALGIYILIDLLYSFQDIAQWGLTSVMGHGSKEHERSALFGRLAGTIGGWLPGLIPLVIGGAEGLANTTVYYKFLAFALILGSGGMLLATRCGTVKERVLTPAPPKKGGGMESIKLLLKNKMVMMVAIGSILSQITFRLDQMLFFTYCFSKVDIFGLFVMDGMQVGFFVGILVGLPGTIAMPFTVWLSRRLGGPKNILILGTASNVLFRLIAYFIGYNGMLVFISMGLVSLASIPGQMNGIATTVLLCDSLDKVEYETGKRNEGSVFAIQNFTAKIGTAVTTFTTSISFVILKYDAKLGADQPPEFFKYAWLFAVLGPGIGNLLNLIPLLFIKYSSADKLRIEAALKERHALQKEKEERGNFDEGLILRAAAIGLSPTEYSIMPTYVSYLEQKKAVDEAVRKTYGDL